MHRIHRHSVDLANVHADGLSVPQALRDFIDEAVHFVITRHYPKTNQGLGKCQVYACLGAIVLTKITGQPFHGVAGGQITDFGGGIYAVSCPTRNERRKAKRLEELYKYHSWIECERSTPGKHSRIELVDFTLRHDSLMAGLLGRPYLLNPARGYLWCWRDELVLPEELVNHPILGGRKEKFWVWKDDYCTRLLHENEKRHALHYESMAGEVFRRLDAQLATGYREPLPAAVDEGRPLRAVSSLVMQAGG